MAATTDKMKALLWFSVLLLSTSVLAKEVTLYFKEGGELRLEPPAAADITVITWKLSGDLVAEWTAGSAVTYYREFKGRASLNQRTGALSIKDARPVFAGDYKVEINDQDVTAVFWRAVLLKALTVPTVERKPLSCSEVSKDCALVCVGDTSQAGPVTYQWRRDEGDWFNGNGTLPIFNDDVTKLVEKFHCLMRNPVSESPSAAIPNPFYVPGVNVTAAVAGTFTVVGVAGLAALVAWCYRSGKYKEYIRTQAEPDK